MTAQVRREPSQFEMGLSRALAHSITRARSGATAAEAPETVETEAPKRKEKRKRKPAPPKAEEVLFEEEPPAPEVEEVEAAAPSPERASRAAAAHSWLRVALLRKFAASRCVANATDPLSGAETASKKLRLYSPSILHR